MLLSSETPLPLVLLVLCFLLSTSLSDGVNVVAAYDIRTDAEVGSVIPNATGDIGQRELGDTGVPTLNHSAHAAAGAVPIAAHDVSFVIVGGGQTV